MIGNIYEVTNHIVHWMAYRVNKQMCLQKRQIETLESTWVVLGFPRNINITDTKSFNSGLLPGRHRQHIIGIYYVLWDGLNLSRVDFSG